MLPGCRARSSAFCVAQFLYLSVFARDARPRASTPPDQVATRVRVGSVCLYPLRGVFVSSRPVARDRYSFGNLEEPLELPDLISVQRDSFKWFLKEGIAEAFHDISPIKDFSEALQLELEFEPDDEDLRPTIEFLECVDRSVRDLLVITSPQSVGAAAAASCHGEGPEAADYMSSHPL